MLNNKKILVVGDILLDEWIHGSVTRLSPEAPIPILDVEHSNKNLGGAGNVLKNLKALEVEPMIIGGVSEDKTGHIIKKMISYICGDNTFYFNIPESFKKQRICSGQQQIVRIDTGCGKEISNIEIDEYLNRLKGKVSIVLISDYGKGSVNDYVLKSVSNFCYEEKIKLIVDPYKTSYYNGFKCDLIKFNKSEAEYFSDFEIENDNDVIECGYRLMDHFHSEAILITLGPKGMVYFDHNKYYKDPYKIVDNPLNVYDVCGAGDSVFAVLGYLMTNDKYNIEDILKYASKAGKLAVSKRGTSVVNKKELFG